MEYLRPSEAVAAADPSGVKLVLVVREKGDANAGPMARVIDALKASGAPAALGGFPTDVETGPVFEAWIKDVGAAGVGIVDAARGVEAVLAVKDEEALLQVKKAGHLAARIGRQVRGRELLRTAAPQRRRRMLQRARTEQMIASPRRAAPRRATPRLREHVLPTRSLSTLCRPHACAHTLF